MREARRWAPVLALLLMVAALAPLGGTAGAAQPTPQYRPGITFGAPVRMVPTDPAAPGGPGEPSIKVDSQGTIYVAGVCCVARAAPAWYSKDGGATFADMPSPGKAREWGFGAEGDFVVDDADSVYFSDTWIPSIFLTKWSGRGDVWEYTNDTVTVLPGVDDRPWLSYSHGALYMYINHVTHTQIWKSTDGGHTWADAYNTIGAGQRFWPGNVAADRRTNDVYFIGRCNPGANTLCTVSSHDGGETWSEVQSGTSPRGAIAPFMVSIDVDAVGNVYGTWADINGNGCDVYLTVSTDRGASWRQYRVNPQTGCATFPWVAAGDDGRVALAWYFTSAKAHQNTVPGSAEWRMQSAVVTQATSDAPVVTYGTLDRVIHRGGLDRDLWDFQQIALGPDGRFHVSFVEDALSGCNAAGLAGYTGKCTDWVAQAGGPRAVMHAADATSVDSLQALGAAGAVEVQGTVTFGRAQPKTMFTNSAISAPGLDLVEGTIVRPSAGADELVFVLKVSGMPEGGVQGTGQFFTWPFTVGGRSFTLNMTPRPWRFEVCTVPTSCTRVRGDTDAGGDRVVARVPLAAIGAKAGEVIAKPGGFAFIESRLNFFAADRGDMGTTTYAIPGATASVTLIDATGAEVATAPAVLSADLSGYSARLEGVAPGTYTATVRACFDTSCASSSSPVTVA